jgi:hypothetical protein
MTIRFASALALATALLVGCSSKPATKSDPVDVTLTVTLPNGQPAKDVTLNVFPTSSNQMQGGGKLDASGKVTTKLLPGKHTFSIEGPPAAMAAVPKKYHSNSEDNSVEIQSTTKDLAIKLTN